MRKPILWMIAGALALLSCSLPSYAEAPLGTPYFIVADYTWPSGEKGSAVWKQRSFVTEAACQALLKEGKRPDGQGDEEFAMSKTALNNYFKRAIDKKILKNEQFSLSHSKCEINESRDVVMVGYLLT